MNIMYLEKPIIPPDTIKTGLKFMLLSRFYKIFEENHGVNNSNNIHLRRLISYLP